MPNGTFELPQRLRSCGSFPDKPLKIGSVPLAPDLGAKPASRGIRICYRCRYDARESNVIANLVRRSDSRDLQHEFHDS